MEPARPVSSSRIAPSEVIRKVAEAMPEECRQFVVVIGSLAAGYYFFGDHGEQLVQTKDIDCLLRPRAQALPVGKKLAERLLDNGWKYHATEEFPLPGNAETPVEKLPVVRLAPPGDESWFMEFLTVPENEGDFRKSYIPLTTTYGRFSLCSLGGIGLTQWDPIQTPYGISIARPEMMAMANLLHHPTIGGELMPGSIAGRSIRRSNKDLGRVLSPAYLAEAKREDSLLVWRPAWEQALREHFPETWAGYAAICGNGLRALLSSPNDLEEAHHTCRAGLVASLQLTEGQLRTAGDLLLVDAIEPLEKLAKQQLAQTQKKAESNS